MFKVLVFLILGVVIGSLFRKRTLEFTPKLITGLIWLLLFILGLEVGSNPQIIAAIGTIGVQAFVITLGAVIGTLLMAGLLWFFVKKRNR